jgi:hypothetical protein
MFMIKFIFLILLLISFICVIDSCRTANNLFSVQQDIEYGLELDRAINNRPSEFSILNESDYSEAYIYLYAMRDELLIAPQVNYRDRYDWQLKILHNDTIVNAFCNPGGYLYIYTGMLKYLNQSDQLAGLLALLIAHCDQRQITASLTALYGTETLMAVANQSASEQVLNELLGTLNTLRFSQDHQTLTDQYSVEYLRITKYACNAAALYMASINPLNSIWGIQKPLLNRIQAIDTIASNYNCSIDTWHSVGDNGDYAAMIATLP